ncbi:uncharacterized protein LOC128316170 [Acinonyx jubatus]|uniref:Uncharacterized protein LOC128316170 n=1 Tax=Acinonyx jubatus TaxID=32536 RepID=A0ABM3QAX4_ACIJB|nr:uncharacterized protein LOC128316170 [Acinonyx jubatus]
MHGLWKDHLEARSFLSSAGLWAGTRWARGGRPPPSPALRTRLRRPRPSAQAKAWHRGLVPQGWQVSEPGGGDTARRPCPRSGSVPLSAWDCGHWREVRAAEGVPTPASLRPPGSRLLVPPRGPKTAGAAAPVVAAACSWRARAAAAAAASSTSTARCLGLPGVSAGLWHGLHRTRRGGSHSSSSAQAGSDRTHGARTAGRGASYYGGRFGLTSAPLPPAPSSQPPDGAAAQARRRPRQTCVCRCLPACCQDSFTAIDSSQQMILLLKKGRASSRSTINNVTNSLI